MIARLLLAIIDALRVQHAKINELGVWRDAQIRALGYAPVTGSD